MAIQVNVHPITARTPPLADLLEQQWMPLVRLAALLVNDADTAPDIVQDCFEAVWRLRPTFDDDAHLAAYLRKAVINRSRSRLRSGPYGQPLPGPGPAERRTARRPQAADRGASS